MGMSEGSKLDNENNTPQTPLERAEAMKQRALEKARELKAC